MSTYQIKCPDAEIDEVLNVAYDHNDRGIVRYPGMSYEQGVADGIEWACGLGDGEPPLSADD